MVTNVNAVNADLVLELTVEPRGPIGYASVYTARVRRVLKGRCTAERLTLTVVGNDDPFALKGPDDVLEAGFVMHQRREPYAVMPITGFVDDQRRSWTLAYVR